jgi:hypothetical protein
MVDLRTIVWDGECLLGHRNAIRSRDTVKFGTFLPPNYHCLSTALTAHWCVSPVSAWVNSFVAAEAGAVLFAVIHEQPFPLPQYCGIGDSLQISSSACAVFLPVIAVLDGRWDNHRWCPFRWRNKGEGVLRGCSRPIRCFKKLDFVYTVMSNQSFFWPTNAQFINHLKC